MKALTVQQPWASPLVSDADDRKNIENRTLFTRHRGPLAIHAGERWSERGARDLRVLDWATSRHLVVLPTQFQRGVLGVVDLVDCHPDTGCCRPWGESSYEEHPSGKTRTVIYHWVTEPVECFEDPVPAKGRLGLWEWDAPVEVLLKIAATRDGASL